ncbi:cell envelope integrity EipB family protein [Lichenihabitans sp. Uapishka_5]|uniref:cell envelope integrity EipB family protein n=1 Tax=Lichenihabitans sp. Uapishka_5 TaxID=3037302 RepID=UPI0029E824FC|nr:cell envelope integrity EipB family protein [Lichenihabitans sp. Uapishka_5]MDX7952230.1 cell envelope integrity EipB family protein [Lichenihabitans sp. Uapishka_5]
MGIVFGPLASIAIGCGAAPALAAGVVLLPHHAVYKLTLASSTGSKAPADASGMITYDFSGSACEGFKTAFRQVTSLQPAEGDARVSATETSTLESGDAAKFDFDIRTSLNQGDADDVKGKATRDKAGALAIALDAPKPTTLDVKAGALFPTEHLSRVITTAENGAHILSASVFDGSDTGQKVFSTLSVIGGPITAPAAEAAAQDAALSGLRRWPVTISYFEPGKDDAQPAYVLSFELYENGVSRALKVDYGTFALAGELVEFKPGQAAPCTK